MYLWVSYGLRCAIEKLWKAELPSIKNGKPRSPYIIEVLAALERSLAFLYTGDARVITKHLMGPLGLKRSLLELGLPSITKVLNFEENIAKTFAHHPANWPLTDSNEPAVASERTQILTFGKEHFVVSL
jgi:hypothetical protein